MIALFDAVVFQTRRAHEMPIFGGMPRDHGLRQRAEIAGGHKGLSAVHPAIGRPEMAIRHSDRMSPRIHRGDPVLDRSGRTFCQHDGSVIG